MNQKNYHYYCWLDVMGSYVLIWKVLELPSVQKLSHIDIIFNCKLLEGKTDEFSWEYPLRQTAAMIVRVFHFLLCLGLCCCSTQVDISQNFHLCARTKLRASIFGTIVEKLWFQMENFVKTCNLNDFFFQNPWTGGGGFRVEGS